MKANKFTMQAKTRGSTVKRRSLFQLTAGSSQELEVEIGPARSQPVKKPCFVWPAFGVFFGRDVTARYAKLVESSC